MGITEIDASVGTPVWNVAGQTCTPKRHSPRAFIWEAPIPDGSCVPPHVHPNLNGSLYMRATAHEIDVLPPADAT